MKRLLALAAAVVAALVVTTPQAQAHTVSPQDVIGIHQVANYFNFAKCLAVKGADSYDGAPAFQFDCTATYYDQHWDFRYDPAGGIRIKNNWTKRCLAFQGSNHANGAPAFEYTCANYDDQRWDLLPRWDNAGNKIGYEIYNLLTKKCLAVQGGNLADGAPAYQYDCVDGYRDQVWQLR